ncbi:MAG: phage tail tape measure protein [Paludibacter sp.]|nr:phage tail tape measure protein [Paludibacter sp.]
MSTQKTTWILELVDKVTSPMRGVTKSVNEPLAAVNKFKFNSDQALDALSTKVPGVGNLIGSLANPYMLAAAGAAAVVAVGYKATTMALDWNEGLAKVNVTAQLTKQELSGLSDQLLDIGTENVAPIEQIPESFNKIISAGLDVKTSLDVLSPSLKAAKAGFNDVGETAKAAVAVMNSSGEDINKVYDILFATLNKGNAEFGDIAQYLPKLIPMARNAGFALNETAGAWAYLTAQGQTSERATTLAQNAMKALADPTKIKAFKEMGLNLFDSSGKIKPLVDIIDDLAGKTKGLSDLSRAQFFGKLGLDQEAASFFATATQDAQKFRETIDFTVNSQGQLNEAYKNAMTPMDSWHQITNLIKGNMIDLGMKVLPVINYIGQGVLDIIQWFKDWYNSSVMLRDYFSAIGNTFEWVFKIAITPIKVVWNLINNIGDALGWVISKIPGFGNGIESMYMKIRPILLYLKELFGQISDIAYKFITGDFKGAVSGVKSFSMPNMADITAKSNLSLSTGKKSDVELSGATIKTNIPTKNIDFSENTKGRGSGLSGSGMNCTKSINQRIEIKNYFTVSEGSNVEAIAEKVIRVINDRLRDATVALS